ncbi:hypothetical protein DSO57_1011594 [Entomophthora muscae]|uniref:Uncharacterized protein n=1 Tax=Entomophthora muscae TaxID=34485 RepID=A0ACC2TH61_9FUNG|nr:hypothetical protein DSO57_1011594 [Entomophthora muscae]
MHPNDILDFNVKPYTEEDRTLALEFHSGNTSHKCFTNNPKYQEEGIISSIILPNSVVQLGFNWVRYIPITEPETSSLEASDSLVIASICNIFSKAITRSLKEKIYQCYWHFERARYCRQNL